MRVNESEKILIEEQPTERKSLNEDQIKNQIHNSRPYNHLKNFRSDTNNYNDPKMRDSRASIITLQVPQ